MTMNEQIPHEASAAAAAKPAVSATGPMRRCSMCGLWKPRPSFTIPERDSSLIAETVAGRMTVAITWSEDEPRVFNANARIETQRGHGWIH